MTVDEVVRVKDLHKLGVLDAAREERYDRIVPLLPPGLGADLTKSY